MPKKKVSKVSARRRKAKDADFAKSSEKRTRKAKKAKIVSGGTNDTWVALPMADKTDLVLNWSINGGVIGGRRYNRKELADALGLRQSDLMKVINTCEKSFETLFNTGEKAKKTLFKMIGQTYYQLQNDRARVVVHSDIIEEEIEIVRKRLIETRKRVALTTKEEQKKNQEINKLLGTFRSLSYQKIETSKTLIDCAEAQNRFLALFKANKDGQLIPETSQITGADTAGLVDQRKAIALIEERSESILPEQDISSLDKGPRNPNKGFEEFKDKEPEDAE